MDGRTPLRHQAVAEDSSPLLLLYGTESGTAEWFAQRAAQSAEEIGRTARVLELDRIRPEQLAEQQCALFFVSTTGIGEMPYTALSFWNALCSPDAPRLEGLAYGMLGFGDRAYGHFCQAARELDTRLLHLGARSVLDRCDSDIDEDHRVLAWISRALHCLGAPPDVESPSKNQAPSPWKEAVVRKNVRITAPASDREVRHLELEVTGARPAWEPGDSIDLDIPSTPELAELVAGLVHDVPGGPPEGIDPPFLNALTQRELRQISRPLLERLAAEDAQLRMLLTSPAPELLEQHLRGMDVAQLLLDHPDAGITASELLDLLQTVRPRRYSISSSPFETPSRISLTVRTVEYSLHGRHHLGTATGTLSRAVRPGDRIPVKIRPELAFRLPDDPSTPILMVATGAGVAPFRSFIDHRELSGKHGPAWLCLGIRSHTEDLLYGDQFEAWQRSGALSRLDLACSREQPGRYVQHLLRDNGDEIFAWLHKGAIIYVCGGANGMVPAVRLTIRGILAERLGGFAAADRRLVELRADRRYREEAY